MNFQKLKLQFVVTGILVLVSGAALAQQGGVKLSTKEGLGSYLADRDGKAIYWHSKDSSGKSVCVGACLEKWSIFYNEKVTPPAGIEAKDFGVITREDGKKQTTFRGNPLYYYTGDKKAGDVSGQGLGADWYVIDPANFPAKGMTPGPAQNKGMTPASNPTHGTPGAAPNQGMSPGATPNQGMTPGANPTHGMTPGTTPNQGTSPAANPAHGMTPGATPNQGMSPATNPKGTAPSAPTKY